MMTARLYLPSLPKSLEKSHARSFFHKTCIYGHLWRQMCSIFGYEEELNVLEGHSLSLLFGRIFFQDLIATADDDNCSFAPTFPSKVLGIKSWKWLFSCNSHIWAPMAPNVLDLWLWGGIKCLEGHFWSLLFGRTNFSGFDCHGWWWRLLVCTYLPFKSPWNKELFHATHIYEHLWRQMCPLFGYGAELNTLWNRVAGTSCIRHCNNRDRK